MAISDELRAQILRYHFVERWRVGTIASQLGVHDRTDEYRGIKLADDNNADAAAEREPQPTRDPSAPPPAFKRRKVHAAFRKKKAAV